MRKSFVEKGEKLVRRQELPPNALKDFEDAASKADAEYTVTAVSHAWLQAGHADPNGTRKKDVEQISHGYRSI